MAKGSNLLGGRVNTRKLKDGGGAGIRVDGIDVAVLIGSRESGYYWPARPDKLFVARTEATDFVIRCLIQEGNIDENAPKRNFRAEAEITNSVKQEVFDRDLGLCQYCLIQGKRVPAEAYDHFIPAAAGGDGTASNVQLACSRCNSVKRHWHPKELWGDGWREWEPLRDRDSSIVRVWRQQ